VPLSRDSSTRFPPRENRSHLGRSSTGGRTDARLIAVANVPANWFVLPDNGLITGPWLRRPGPRVDLEAWPPLPHCRTTGSRPTSTGRAILAPAPAPAALRRPRRAGAGPRRVPHKSAPQSEATAFLRRVSSRGFPLFSRPGSGNWSPTFPGSAPVATRPPVRGTPSKCRGRGIEGLIRNPTASVPPRSSVVS